MVYVDTMYEPRDGVEFCHLCADTSEELDELAHGIGLSILDKRQNGPVTHYKVGLKKREKAVMWGAKELTARELIKKFFIKRRR